MRIYAYIQFSAWMNKNNQRIQLDSKKKMLFQAGLVYFSLLESPLATSQLVSRSIRAILSASDASILHKSIWEYHSLQIHTFSSCS